jgi:hypothetical protein
MIQQHQDISAEETAKVGGGASPKQNCQTLKSPDVALNRRAERPCECLLSGQKQTERGNDKTSAFGPTRTSVLLLKLPSHLIRYFFCEEWAIEAYFHESGTLGIATLLKVGFNGHKD